MYNPDSKIDIYMFVRWRGGVVVIATSQFFPEVLSAVVESKYIYTVSND